MSFEFISNMILCALCIYQGYRLRQLKIEMLDHIIDLLRHQNITLQLIRNLYERNKNEKRNTDD